MSQIGGARRGSTLCAKPGCLRPALETAARLCWEHHDTRAPNATSPSARDLNPTSSARTYNEGERKAKRTRTGLFSSGSLPGYERRNGTSASGRNPAHTGPLIQRPLPSIQHHLPSEDASRQLSTRATNNADHQQTSDANIGPHSRSSAEATTSITVAIPTDRQPVKQPNPQRYPSLSQFRVRGAMSISSLTNGSKLHDTPQSTRHVLSRDGGAVSGTWDPDGMPGRSEPKPLVVRASHTPVLSTIGSQHGHWEGVSKKSTESIADPQPRLKPPPGSVDVIDLTGNSDDDSQRSRRHSPALISPSHQSRTGVSPRSRFHDTIPVGSRLEENPPPRVPSRSRNPPHVQSQDTRCPTSASQVLPQTGNHSRSVASGACKPTAPYTSLQLGLGSPPVPKDDETPANHKNHPGSDKRWSNSTGEDSTVKFNPSCTAERPAVNNVRPGLSSVTPISQIRGESIGQGFLAQANSLETSSRVAAHEPQGVKQLPVEPLPSNGSHSTLSASNHDSNTQSAPAPEKTTGVVNATRETSTSKAEANRRARVAKFDSAAFDSQIYAQEVCLSAPEGVASYPPHDIRDRSDYGRVFLRTNPAIHGMHTRSEEWYRRKAAEIQARPRRKAWFGKVTQRQRWLRSREKKMSQVESTDGLAEASSFREEPQPRGHRHRPDLVGVPEAELPADVKESAAWAKACVRFRSDMETKRKMENTYLRKQLEQRTMHAQRYTATWECEDTAKQQRPRPGGRAECGEKLSLSKVVTREEILRMANQETERFFEELRNTSSPNPAGGRVALPG